MRVRFFPVLLVALTLSLESSPGDAAATELSRYNAMVRRVADMPNSERVVVRSRRHGLDVLNVLWEDTGRWEGSSFGPNISDVTIEVELKSAEQGRRTRTALMPVLRYPNFSDLTGDVRAERIWLPVGNHAASAGDPLTKVTLAEFLENPSMFMSAPDAGRIKHGRLSAKRDSHVLVSAQAAFLPVPKDGQATFWPVIFNYQSTRQTPAVLTLLVTRQGTSVTIIDNARDTIEGSWGQRLFFNKNGQRAPLTAERLSRVQASGVTANGEAASSLGADANVLMIVQVPLKVPAPKRKAEIADDAVVGLGAMGMGAGGGGYGSGYGAAARSDVETAVLGHGPVLGPFTELDGRTIERDARFPVRVTVQLYQATATGAPTAMEIGALATQIKKVYASADYVGSLVEPREVDRTRPTAWYGMSKPTKQPECADFPGLVERGICDLTALTAL